MSSRHGKLLSLLIIAGVHCLALGANGLNAAMPDSTSMQEVQVTDRPGGHILTNTGVWSPDGRWIVYDTRSDPAGEKFDGDTIEIVNVETREVRDVYRSRNGAHCGVATYNPARNQVVFILGSEAGQTHLNRVKLDAMPEHWRITVPLTLAAGFAHAGGK